MNQCEDKKEEKLTKIGNQMRRKRIKGMIRE